MKKSKYKVEKVITCRVTGCDYACFDVREFYRHLIKVHGFKRIKFERPRLLK